MTLSEKKIRLLYFLVPLSALGAYLYTFKIGFVWDDYLYIQQQLASIREFDVWGSLRKGVYFRPTVTVFSVLDYNIWHRNPLGYHITNIIFHTLNALLVSLLAYRLSDGIAALGDPDKASRAYLFSILSGLLFALHPLHTESVNWIEGRTDLICTTFFLLSVISYVVARQERNLKALVPTIVFALFAFGAKEPAVMLPVVIAAYEAIYSEHRKKVLAVSLLACGIVALVVMSRSHIFREIIEPQLSKGGISEFAKLLVISYGFYLKKIVWPLPLNFFIGKLPEDPFFFLFSILSTLALGLVMVVFRDRKKVISFMIVWWFLTIAPHGVILLGSSATAPVAERYLYLPSVAFCIVLGFLLTKVKVSYLRWGFMAGIAVFYGVTTFHRTAVWTDGEVLWKDTIDKSPEFATPYIWYGNALYEKDKVEEAIEAWKRGLQCPYMTGKGMDTSGIDDSFRKNLLYTSIGLGYIRLGDYDRAVENLKTALSFFTHYHAYYLLGMIERSRAEKADDEYNKKLHLEKALKLLGVSVKLNPHHQESIFFLALTEKELGLTLEAMEHFKMAFELDPRTNMGIQSVFFLEQLKAKAYSPAK